MPYFIKFHKTNLGKDERSSSSPEDAKKLAEFICQKTHSREFCYIPIKDNTHTVDILSGLKSNPHKTCVFYLEAKGSDRTAAINLLKKSKSELDDHAPFFLVSGDASFGEFKQQIEAAMPAAMEAHPAPAPSDDEENLSTTPPKKPWLREHKAWFNPLIYSAIAILASILKAMIVGIAVASAATTVAVSTFTGIVVLFALIAAICLPIYLVLDYRQQKEIYDKPRTVSDRSLYEFSAPFKLRYYVLGREEKCENQKGQEIELTYQGVLSRAWDTLTEGFAKIENFVNDEYEDTKPRVASRHPRGVTSTNGPVLTQPNSKKHPEKEESVLRNLLGNAGKTISNLF
jgi:hypothetical protein